mmetsp:Transcript_28025/g.51767  ORF Transcript_28025/g.51767 Transcript_28025/m.51767 type:complete len:81 (-) Transcript_28025:970-1212(-)
MGRGADLFAEEAFAGSIENGLSPPKDEEGDILGIPGGIWALAARAAEAVAKASKAAASGSLTALAAARRRFSMASLCPWI